MKSHLIKLWKAAQPYLRKPRLWVAYGLRALLWRTRFIAITGSNGKSTATRYLAAILSAHAPTQWTRMNRNTEPGLTETIAFCNPFRTRYAVFEVGAGGEGAVEKAARLIRPHVAVELSVFLEHRSFFRNIENVAQEKAVLLRHLQDGGLAVLNAEDPRVAEMPVPATCRTIRVGFSPAYDVHAENVQSAWPQLLRFTAVVKGRRQDIQTRLLGTHWVPTLLACIAVADEMGVPLDLAARVIRDVTPYPGRMQAMTLPSGAAVIRDEFKGSAHTADAAFEELRRADAGRKFILFGDVAESALGPRKRLSRVGRKAAAIADFVAFVGEKSDYGRRGALAGGLAEDHAFAFTGYEEAAETLSPLLGPGDLVLLKGGRHDMSRFFFSQFGTVRCHLRHCDKCEICDECVELGPPELLRAAARHAAAVTG